MENQVKPFALQPNEVGAIILNSYVFESLQRELPEDLLRRTLLSEQLSQEETQRLYFALWVASISQAMKVKG